LMLVPPAAAVLPVQPTSDKLASARARMIERFDFNRLNITLGVCGRRGHFQQR